MFRRLYSNLSQRMGAATASTRCESGYRRDTEHTLKNKSKRSNSNERTPTTDYTLTAAAPTPLRINNPNKKHPCGSVLSANANYSHWYAHRYGIPHQNSIATELTSSRDLDHLMKLQHTNPNVNLYPFLAMGESLPSDTTPRKEETEAKADNKAAEEEAIAKACNENHAHWFKHQYCMVPDWEVDCFQQSRTPKSNFSRSNQKNGEKNVDPIEAHAQPRRDIRSFDFSVRVQHAHLDTRDASKLFNIA